MPRERTGPRVPPGQEITRRFQDEEAIVKLETRHAEQMGQRRGTNTAALLDQRRRLGTQCEFEKNRDGVDSRCGLSICHEVFEETGVAVCHVHAVTLGLREHPLKLQKNQHLICRGKKKNGAPCGSWSLKAGRPMGIFFCKAHLDQAEGLTADTPSFGGSIDGQTEEGVMHGMSIIDFDLDIIKCFAAHQDKMAHEVCMRMCLYISLHKFG